MAVEAHFADITDAWVWIVPHPADPDRARGRGVRTRVGTGSLDGFEPILELRSKPGRMLGGWPSELLDLTGNRPRPAGELDVFLMAGGGRALRRATCRVDEVAAEFDLEGRLAVGDAEDHCTIATRGKPAPGAEAARVPPLGLRELLRGRGRQDEELRTRRDALRRIRAEALRVDDVVSAPATAFDGWLTATQHRTAVGQTVAEAWHVRIDRSRPAPAPLAPALVITCAALCHRAAIGSLPAGVLDLLAD